MQPGPLNGTDVHEDILAAVIRLNETKAFLAIEPLHCSLRHQVLLSDIALRSPHPSAVCSSCSRFGRSSLVRRESRGEAKSFGRSSMLQILTDRGLFRNAYVRWKHSPSVLMPR